MTSETSLAAIRDQLLGRTVTDRQLAGNSLSLWVDKVPGSDGGWTIWLEPTWHLVGAEGLLAGSMQAQDEEDASGWQAVGKTIDALVGRTIEALEVEPQTHDLTVSLSGGLRVRTFASDPRETLHWRIKDYVSGHVLSGAPTGIHLERAI